MLPAVQLAWDRNPEHNIAGYELRYGTSPGVYPNVVDAGSNTTAAISGLEKGVTYHFVVVARNTGGQISQSSVEVTYRVEPPVIAPPVIEPTVIGPPVAEITSPARDLTITTGDTVNFAGTGSDPAGNTSLTYSWRFSSGGDTQVRNPGNRKFTKAGIYTVSLTVANSKGIADPTPVTRTIVVRDPVYTSISRTGWKVTYVDSQETAGYAARNAVDGNPSTFWHTRFKTAKLKKPPHEMVIDMRSSHKVSGFQYLPRQDGYKIGNVGKFRFYVSTDGKNWGNPVASGAFRNSSGEKKIFFNPKDGRYIRLRILSEASGYYDSNVAELKVLELAEINKTATTASSSVASTGTTTTAPAAKAASAASATISSLAPTATAPITPPKISTVAIDGKKYLALTITKPTIPDGVKRTAEVSPNLLDWFSGKNFTTVIADNDRFLKIRDNTPITTSRKRHIRLKSFHR